MKTMMLALAVLFAAAPVVRAQVLEEAQKQLLLLNAESARLEEAARAMSQTPAEMSGTLILTFPGPRVETTNPTAEEIAAILAEREAYWTKRKAEIQGEAYEFRASTGMVANETRLVEAILLDVAADKAAVKAGTFDQALIERKAGLLKNWLEFLRFKRDHLLGLEPHDAGKKP